MKDTVRLSAGACRLVAHRGLSGLETENTCAAFVAAGLRGYWGIETDVHPTSDGRFVCTHDPNLRRVSGVDFDVREHTLAEAQAVPLLGPGGTPPSRSDRRVPAFEDYLAICAAYGRVPVVELKGPFGVRTVRRIAALVREAGLLDRAVFISFNWSDCERARRVCPDNEVLFLGGPDPAIPMERHASLRIGADYRADRIGPELVRDFHAAGLRVNAWTVDTLAAAARLLDMGVDLITTNVLEEA